MQRKQRQLLIVTIAHERSVAASTGRKMTLLAQQFIGLALFANYSYFFQQAGVSNPFRAIGITSSIGLAADLGIVFIADPVGRRLLSCSGTTACWSANVIVGILGVIPRGKATNYLSILFARIWTNGATWWGFIGEISSQRLGPYIAGFAAAISCVAGVVMSVVTPYMVNVNDWNWGLKTGWFYAGVGLPFTVAIWFLIPETAGYVS
ncbi:hypothetical protein BJX63DRAFT_438260 [Aspergillus granulosus]|uniref:Major facilitator superfamily (MFS) profile domain-containing protein n=1 Tax=Aspergillus granulosus TaxID=176169 RepID=A0ABR4GSH3_9EURO